MNINLSKLKKLGYTIDITDTEIEIYPSNLEANISDQLVDLFKDHGIERIYAYELAETAAEYQLLSHIKQSFK